MPFCLCPAQWLIENLAATTDCHLPECFLFRGFVLFSWNFFNIHWMQSRKTILRSEFRKANFFQSSKQLLKCHWSRIFLFVVSFRKFLFFPSKLRMGIFFWANDERGVVYLTSEWSVASVRAQMQWLSYFEVCTKSDRLVGHRKDRFDGSVNWQGS